MSDPKQKLTPGDVSAAGLADWRQLLSQLHARFRTPSYATGLALVQRIGEAADTADHHPDLTLTYPEVGVSLSSHDVGGLTSRDVDLARTISAYAAELGCVADVAGLTQVELGLDTSRGGEHALMYAALLGAQVKDGEVVDASGQVPTLWWQGQRTSEDGEEGHALPEPAVPQRWHLDVWVPEDEAERRLAAALEAGGRLVSDASAPSFWVIEDPEGNRSCICTVSGRGQD